MFQKIRTAGAKLAAVPALALVTVGSAFAEETDHVAAITTKVTNSMEGAAGIAGVVVLGLFSIWAIKLLWRGK